MEYINTKKIEKFNFNDTNYYVVIDFDRTITSKESEDSWSAVANKEVINNELIEKMDELYQIYRPIELDYNISFEEKERLIEKWYQDVMDLYYQYNLTKEKLEKSVAKSNLIFRNGMKEFLDKLQRQNIPVIILSAGIGNVIEQFLRANNCYFTNMHVISNFIEFDEKGNMKKYNKKMIHSLNKTIVGKLSLKLQKEIETKEYAILLGDLIEDISMVPKEKLDTTLTIGFLNGKVEENLKIYNERFDIVEVD